MDEELKQSKEKSLQDKSSDYIALAVNSALGAVPLAGPLLAEIAGNVIPNQRIDRIVKYAEQLQYRLGQLEESAVRAHLTNENFTDLVEESLRQAARALTEERREYLASMVANSIKSEDIEFFESKHLLRILGELNDIEIIWLRFFLNPVLNDDTEFREKNAHIIDPVIATLGTTQPAEKSTLQNSYKEHLASIGLLEKKVEIDTQRTGSKLKTRGYNITSLGRLLLRELGFTDKRLG